MKKLLFFIVMLFGLSTTAQVPLKYVGMMMAYDPDGDSLDWEVVAERPEGANWMITPNDKSSAKLWMARMEKASWKVDVKVTDPGGLFDIGTMYVEGSGCDTLEYYETHLRDTTVQVPTIVMVDSTYVVVDTVYYWMVPIPQPCVYDTIPKGGAP